MSENAKLKNRTERLTQLKRLLVSLRSGIRYTSAPLGELLREAQNPVAAAVVELSQMSGDLSAGWRSAAQKLFVKPEDRRLMEEFLEDFGRSDFEEQSRLITAYLERLSDLISEARTEAESKGKVKIAAGSFFSAALALILA